MIRIQRETLLRPLQLANGVVERKQTQPILSNLLLRASAQALSIAATDLELSLVMRIPLLEGEEAAFTLPARKFLDIARALPEGAEVSLSLEDTRAVIRSGRSRFALPTLPPEEFPQAPAEMEGQTFGIPQKALKEAMERTHFAMAQQDMRYYLNGMLFDLSNNTLRVVATDGHRLALCRIEEVDTAGGPLQAIVPRKAVLELLRLLEEEEAQVALTVNPHHLRADFGDIVLTSKLIEGRFPDYERVIPQGGEQVMVAEREALRRALARCAILTTDQNPAVRFGLGDGVLRLSTRTPEEEAEEELPVDYSGEAMEIGFNVSYLLDALNAMTEDEVEMHLTGPHSGCLLKARGQEACLHVVMPMRL